MALQQSLRAAHVAGGVAAAFTLGPLTAAGYGWRAMYALGLVALPLVDPAIGVTFSILRLESRTLPPIAEVLAASIVTADRATVEMERELAATPPARAARSAPGRQCRAAEASAAR